VRARLCGWDDGAASVLGAISVLAVGGRMEFGEGCGAVSQVEGGELELYFYLVFFFHFYVWLFEGSAIEWCWRVGVENGWVLHFW
jgi:hypothetical protein